MSYILNWINKNLLNRNKQEEQIKLEIEPFASNLIEDKKENVIETKTDIDTHDIVIKDENEEKIVQIKEIKKWIPNDSLYKRYNIFLDNVNKIKKHKTDLTKHVNRSKFLIKEFTQLKGKTDVESKINASMTKQELLNIEAKIKQGEDAIKELETIDSAVLDEWDEYVEEARNFLVLHNISDLVNTNEILNSQALYVTAKKIIDGYIVSLNDDKYLELLERLESLFDVKEFKARLKYTDQEFENKKKKIMDRIGNSDTLTDLTVPHRLTTTAYNENSSNNEIAPNINITGSVNMVIATPVSNSQFNSGIPIASAYIDNTPNTLNITNSPNTILTNQIEIEETNL